jgi:hypothetical protein
MIIGDLTYDEVEAEAKLSAGYHMPILTSLILG